jgi:phage/plasmid-like protein (TIGR03299 family)
MAHNLSEVGGRTEMFYRGEAPWHGLGTSIEGAITVEQALALAAPFTVESRPIQQEGKDIEGWKGLTRSDTRAFLAAVRSTYQVFQPRETFEFMDDVIGSGRAIYHTGGTLCKGERIWLTAKLKDPVILPGEDTVEKFLLLVNSYDGTLALRMFYTPVRVVCQNTLTAAIEGAGSMGIAIRHRGALQARVDEAKRVLGLADEFYGKFSTIANTLACTRVGSRLGEYLEYVYPDRKDNDLVREATRKQVAYLFEVGRGTNLVSARGTLWGAYNAVAEFEDHARNYRKLSSRFVSTTVGQAAMTKRAAWNTALEFAGVKA